jgi:flagellar motor switch protein FliG
MGFIKILRWHVGGSPPRLSRRQNIESDSLHRAAVFLVVLGKEHATLLFDKFTPEESRALQDEVHSVSEADRSVVADVLHEYLDGLSTDNLPPYVSRDDLPDVARSFVRADPDAVVERVRGLWVHEEVREEEGVEEEPLLELDFDALEPAQKATVFMMWLPPELSAMVLDKFPSSLVHLVTGIVVELPFVKPEARERVLSEFMDGVSLGIPGLTVEDVGLPVVVETFVRSDPEAVAKRLEERWLADRPTVASPTPKASPSAKLSGIEKAAVFFTSLSLPLSYKLLACMEENEVESLLKTVDKLPAVDAHTRKSVLQNLMSKDGSEGESQPVHILGKAMGQMIRRKPEVVVNKIRKQWLSE